MNALNVKWCLFKYLDPVYQHSAGIRKVIARELDFKDMKFPVKVRDIHRIRKKRYSLWL